MNIKITIFTPTYNRSYIIGQLYESLKRQTSHEFEWLVVDDGSVDETEKLFKTWMIENNNFTIRYYKRENSGKCQAINYGLDLAQGELFFVVDSDDYLTDDAIEKVLKWEKDLPVDDKFCGIAGNLGITNSLTPNTLFNTAYYDGTLLDRYNVIDGERALIFYTKIHQCYKYPQYEGEKFMTEAVAYNRIANDGYKMRFYNDIICIYEYQDDGLTKAGNTLFTNNPRGYGLWLKEKSTYMKLTLKEKIRIYYNFSCEMSVKYDVKTIAESIEVSIIFIKLLLLIHSIIKKLKRRNDD